MHVYGLWRNLTGVFAIHSLRLGKAVHEIVLDRDFDGVRLGRPAAALAWLSLTTTFQVTMCYTVSSVPSIGFLASK